MERDSMLCGSFLNLSLLLICCFLFKGHCDYSYGDPVPYNSFTISSFSYPETRLKPYDWRYIRVELPPWFSSMSISLESDVDFDFRSVMKVPTRNQYRGPFCRSGKSNSNSSVGFSKLTSIGELAQKMVECGKNKLYPQVYLLLTLALTLPVATATVERVFSAMNAIKTKWRNRMSDEWLRDSLILFVEKDIFEDVSVETIMERFQNMKTRRGCL